MIAVFDDMLGAVYALIDAHKLGFKGKASESDYAAIEKRSKQLSNGEVRRVGNWMAGFHFNSGCFASRRYSRGWSFGLAPTRIASGTPSIFGTCLTVA